MIRPSVSTFFLKTIPEEVITKYLFSFFFFKFIEQVDRKGELNEIFFMLIGIEREDRWIGSTQVDWQMYAYQSLRV